MRIIVMRAVMRVLCPALAAVVLVAPLAASRAAELDVPRARAHARTQPYCSPCGCLEVTWVRHRDIQSTYGLSYDPRNYDATTPHFYPGRLHAYPRYFVDGLPAPGAC